MSSVFPFDDSFNVTENFVNPLEMIAEAIPELEQLEDLGDGSSVFRVKKEKIVEETSEDDFYANLADKLDEVMLNSLGGKLLDEIKQDKESRAEWEKTIKLAMDYLGFKIEEFRNVPFLRACAAFDSTLSISLIRSYATARAELFPAAGPVKCEVYGVSTPQVEDEASRVKMFMNYYLTKIDRDYYPDSERLLMYVILFGCAFRKVYQDPIMNRPVARLIAPHDFIINHNTTSILSSTRISEVMYLTKKEIMLRQASGDFIEFELPSSNSDDNKEDETIIEKNIRKTEGVEPNINENKSLFKFYECHVELDAGQIEPEKKKKKKKSIPRPYIVTICDANRKIVSIKRNWEEGDKKFKRLEYYVNYYYLPGYGIYSLGLAHLLGSNAITLTSILRQTVDKGTLNNFPGGLRKKGLRIENNDKATGPSEFLEVETGELPLDQCVMFMPYGEPSQGLINLGKELKQDAAVLASTAEAQVPEAGTNTPVGTILAKLEVQTKVQSTVLRSLHNALGYELSLLFNLFGKYLGEEPYPFLVKGAEVAIMKQDFSDKINISPVSDPNVMTSTHRLIRAEALLNLAQGAPDLHNMKAVYERVYSAMNVDNIEEILKEDPRPQPLDAMTENMNSLKGEPINVALFQDHDAHNIVHKKFIQDIMQNPQLYNPQTYTEMMLHIQKHDAFKLYIQLQQMNPMAQVPEEQILMMPEIQNELSKKNAGEALEQMEQAQQQMMAAEEEKKHQLDPNAVMMADIEQRREAAYLKEQESKLRAEIEAFKAQLKFEGDQAKIEAEQEMAIDKNEVDLTLASIKQPNPF